MKTAYALLGGPTAEWPQDLLQELHRAKKNHQLLLASDRGSLYLQEMGLTADLAVGDFDSLKKSELQRIENSVADLRYSHPVKDLTDSELLFAAAFEDYQIDYLKVFGATGGRLDHFLVNLFTFLHQPLQQYCQQVELIDQQNKIKLLLPGEHQLGYDADYSYLGIGSLTGIKDLTIRQARYNLNSYSTMQPIMFSSNEFVKQQPITVSFAAGMAIVIYTKDKNKFQNLK